MIKLAKASDIVVGRILYRVHAFLETGETWIEKITCLSKPFDIELSTNNLSKFFYHDYVSTYYHDERIKTTSSLNDLNIPINNYNMHCLCIDKESAELYVKYIQDKNNNELEALGIISTEKMQTMSAIQDNKSSFPVFVWCDY